MDSKDTMSNGHFEFDEDLFDGESHVDETVAMDDGGGVAMDVGGGAAVAIGEEGGGADMYVDGLDPHFNPFSKVSLFVYDGTRYYKKNTHAGSVDLWNELYGHDGIYTAELGRSYVANYDGKDGYFPELGLEVDSSDPNFLEKCKAAYETLLSHGYHHNDLYNDNSNPKYCNPTNLRKIGDKYYPIDTSKIMHTFAYGGKKRHTKRKRSIKKKRRISRKYKTTRRRHRRRRINPVH